MKAQKNLGKQAILKFPIGVLKFRKECYDFIKPTMRLKYELRKEEYT